LTFQGGNSIDARENGANVSDYYFMNGNILEGFQEQIGDMREGARSVGREGEIRFAVNGFAIAKEMGGSRSNPTAFRDPRKSS
jgi:alkanesulfonate monooxygenase